MNDELSEQAKQRRDKLAALRERGGAYPNDFRRTHEADALLSAHRDASDETLEAEPVHVALAGRIMTRRVMGKASFAHLQDVSGRIQTYVRRDDLPEGQYADFKQWDLGDIVGVEGTMFRTRTGELSIKASSIRLLVKSLLPLPEKFHGLSDVETRYRQRYVDLITNERSREVFKIRSRVVSYLRGFFIERDFLEVETPMMHPIPGGAVARPFVTHHNALDMALYLRIAPELYLKRLVVGGLERVFEINRNFRNEGVSTQHNPEFTMLEFYKAYSEVNDIMDMTEDMVRGAAATATGSAVVEYQGEAIDFSRAFERLTMKDAIVAYNESISAADLNDDERTRGIASRLGVTIEPHYGRGKLWQEIFERTVEARLAHPTFITEHPTEVSPLSRANDDDPFVSDRFELFIAGKEIANGFSELNDPDDQAARFRAQAESRESGDAEAMYFDADYIRALEHGLPPTGGQGLGIDRLVMLLTDSASIRDVLLFPHMRPEA